MKKIISILASLALVASIGTSVSAIGEEMNVVKGTPSIDGVIDEMWASADRQQLGYLKGGDLVGDGTLPETSSAYASMMWDDGALYFLFEINDDDLSFAGSTGDWRNDSIYLYVDETCAFTGTWQAGQNQIALIPSENMSAVPRNGTAPADYEMAYTVDGNNAVIEFKYVPAMAELAADLELVIDFQYNDGTAANTRDYCFGWSDETDGASGNSNVWGWVKLSSEAAAGAASAAADETEAPAEETEAPAEETEAPADETEAPAEETEAPAEETEEVVDTAEPADETAAPQTSDVTTVITLAGMISALAAFALTRKKANA